jgi:hypothetical protein
MRGLVLAIAALQGMAACGTTHRFADQLQLTVDRSDKDARRAAAELFEPITPYTVSLCEAELGSRECKKDSEGIRASGVGGLFLPLALHVTAMTIRKQDPADYGWIIEASFQSSVDAISPLCRTAHGRILLGDNNTVSVRVSGFYCNWMLVGNVIVDADFSIDHIDPKDKLFTGFYRITFHGTGNAAGSGYYRAAILGSDQRTLRATHAR